MYNDFYLKFADEAEANAVLFEGDGEERKARYNAIDIIGTIYKPTGKKLTTPEGEVPEMAPIDGFHANVRHMGNAPELEPYKVSPATPCRGWF